VPTQATHSEATHQQWNVRNIGLSLLIDKDDDFDNDMVRPIGESSTDSGCDNIVVSGGSSDDSLFTIDIYVMCIYV